MGWTLPRMLAEGNDWFDDDLDHDGPACYELGTGGPFGGLLQWHYVGETSNERARMSAYAEHGSHLADIIHDHLRQGWTLYYRAISCRSKSEAKRMQDGLLASYRYDWNVVDNY